MQNESHRNARAVLKRKRGGEKVTAEELKQACLTLGIKNQKYKDFKASVRAKKEKLQAIREKVAAAKAKRALKTNAS